MTTAYFWKNEEVVPFDGYAFHDRVTKQGLNDLFCIDLTERDIEQRYGTFVTGKAWVHFPLETFPKEFLAQLLLMGVPL